MTGSTLMSPGEAAKKIARLFEGGVECRISVREDRVFGDRRLLWASSRSGQTAGMPRR